MRAILVTTLVTVCALSAAPAQAQGEAPSWSRAERTQYRAFKQQVRQAYKALRQIKRQRPLSPAEKQRLDTLKEARGSFSSAAFSRVGGYGLLAGSAGLVGGSILAPSHGVGSHVASIAMSSLMGFGLSLGPGYTCFTEAARHRARGVAQGQRAGIQAPPELRGVARRTLMMEARAKLDVARMMAQPSVSSAAQVRSLADSLR